MPCSGKTKKGEPCPRGGPLTDGLCDQHRYCQWRWRAGCWCDSRPVYDGYCSVDHHPAHNAYPSTIFHPWTCLRDANESMERSGGRDYVTGRLLVQVDVVADRVFDCQLAAYVINTTRASLSPSDRRIRGLKAAVTILKSALLDDRNVRSVHPDSCRLKHVGFELLVNELTFNGAAATPFTKTMLRSHIGLGNKTKMKTTRLSRKMVANIKTAVVDELQILEATVEVHTTENEALELLAANIRSLWLHINET